MLQLCVRRLCVLRELHVYTGHDYDKYRVQSVGCSAMYLWYPSCCIKRATKASSGHGKKSDTYWTLAIPRTSMFMVRLDNRLGGFNHNPSYGHSAAIQQATGSNPTCYTARLITASCPGSEMLRREE